MNGLMASSHSGLGESRGKLNRSNVLTVASASSWLVSDGRWTTSDCGEKHCCNSIQ